MTLWIRAAGIVVAAATLLPVYAAADGTATSAPRQSVREAPTKDCTRLNGRIGYYGNPWCTPAEQARWDRHEGRRFVQR